MNIEKTSQNSARLELDFDVSRDRLEEATRQAISDLPRWTLEDDGGSQADSQDDIHAIRTTQLLRFKDDIRVAVIEIQGGARITATSASRVGKGDLGQNPRNLKQLVEAVNKSLQTSDSTR